MSWTYDNTGLGQGAPGQPNAYAVRRPENIRNRCWTKLAKAVCALLEGAAQGGGGGSEREKVLEDKVRTLRRNLLAEEATTKDLQKRLREWGGAWVENKLGACPLTDPTTNVMVKFNNGTVTVGRANNWIWDLGSHDGNISHWRLP